MKSNRRSSVQDGANKVALTPAWGSRTGGSLSVLMGVCCCCGESELGPGPAVCRATQYTVVRKASGGAELCSNRQHDSADDDKPHNPVRR